MKLNQTTLFSLQYVVDAIHLDIVVVDVTFKVDIAFANDESQYSNRLL